MFSQLLIILALLSLPHGITISDSCSQCNIGELQTIHGKYLQNTETPVHILVLDYSNITHETNRTIFTTTIINQTFSYTFQLPSYGNLVYTVVAYNDNYSSNVLRFDSNYLP